MQIRQGAAGICCAKLASRSVRRGGHRRHSSALSRPSVERRSGARVDGPRAHLDHRRSPGGRARLVGCHAGRRPDARRARQVDVGFHRCGIDPDARNAIAFLRDIAALPGLRSGPPEPRGARLPCRSEDELRRTAKTEAAIHARLAAAAQAAGIPIDEISVGATPTARYSLDEPGVTEMRPGNYVYLDRAQVRSTRHARRLRHVGHGHRREQARGRSHHSRLRQQDAQLRRGAWFTKPDGYARSSRTSRRARLTGRSWSSGCLRNTRRSRNERIDTAPAGRPRPRPAESRLRRVEPVGPGVPGRRPAGRGHAGHRCAGKIW